MNHCIGWRQGFVAAAVFAMSAGVGWAQDAKIADDDAAKLHAELDVEVEKSIGSVTGLPLPRYVSLKSGKGRVRRGPRRSHPIEWEFTHRGMPLEIVGEYEHWRRIRIWDGSGGWMHYSLLSGARTVVVVGDEVPLHVTPEDGSATTAVALKDVVAKLGKCSDEWCHIRVDRHRGWVLKSQIWGVYAHEIRE